jgi:hypothetical protein
LQKQVAEAKEERVPYITYAIPGKILSKLLYCRRKSVNIKDYYQLYEEEISKDLEDSTGVTLVCFPSEIGNTRFKLVSNDLILQFKNKKEIIAIVDALVDGHELPMTYVVHRESEDSTMDIREASHVIESDLVITPIFEGELLDKSFDKLQVVEEIIKLEVARDEKRFNHLSQDIPCNEKAKQIFYDSIFKEKRKKISSTANLVGKQIKGNISLDKTDSTIE